MDRRTVTLSDWSGDVPSRIVLRYPRPTQDLDPKWREGILAMVWARMGYAYDVGRHDTRRCRLELVLSGDALPTPVEPVRYEQVISDLLGASAKIRDVDLVDGVPCRIVVDGVVGVKAAVPGYRGRVERTLSVLLPGGRWKATWDLEHDSVIFETRLSLPTNEWLQPFDVPDGDVLANYDSVAIPCGVDEDGNVMYWRPALDPNLLVVGAPGTGKTVFMHTLLAAVSRYGWPSWIVDGKAFEFLGFRSWPNVQIVAGDIEEQIAVLERAHAVMTERYRMIKLGLASESDFEPLILIVDEFADIKANALTWYSNPDIRIKGVRLPPVFEQLASIARKGRSARVHLILATQRPDVTFLGGEMRDNFRARFAFGRLSRDGAAMMWESSIGISLPKIRGRCMAMTSGGHVVEMQGFFTPDPRKIKDQTPEMASRQTQRLDELRPSVVTHPRLLILPPETSDDGEGFGYYAYANAEWVWASSRPDLDPEAGDRSSRTADERRVLASPLTLLGLNRKAGVSCDAVTDEIPVVGAETTKPVAAGVDTELLREAIELVVNTQFVSTAMLQRKLRIGFANACQVLAELERLEIVAANPAVGESSKVLFVAEDLPRALALVDGSVSGGSAGTVTGRTDQELVEPSLRDLADQRPESVAFEGAVPEDLSDVDVEDVEEEEHDDEFDDGGVDLDFEHEGWGSARFAEYGPTLSIPVGKARVGDVVLIDPDSDHWAVVDEEVGDDVRNAQDIAVCWRDDDDQYGVLAMDPDSYVIIRRMVED